MIEQDSGSHHTGGNLAPYDGPSRVPFALPERDRIRPGCEKPPVLTVYLARHMESLAISMTPSLRAR
jgi:hypothetical protein